MAQAPTDIEKEADASRADDTEGLAQAVDQLVSEIDKTVRTFDQDDAPADESSVEDAVEPAVTDEPAVEPIVDGAIDDQVDELVDEATGAIVEPEPASAPTGEFEAPPSIDDLDEALASAADEDDDFDLEGDFEESSSVIEVASPVPTPPTPTAAAAHPPVVAPAEEASDVESATEEPAAKPAKPKVDTAALVVSAIEKPARLLSAPLRMAPEAHRDTIGWIALNTLFLAVCVWLYVLLLR